MSGAPLSRLRALEPHLLGRRLCSSLCHSRVPCSHCNFLAASCTWPPPVLMLPCLPMVPNQSPMAAPEFGSGNLDEKVPGRVLYEILIQAGHVVDLHIPCDKETGRPKGFAFAEYETEAIAQYAVRLFSGLVRLNGKTLKFVEGEIEYVEGDDIEMVDMDDMEDFEGFGDEDDNVKKLYIF
ncbi:hypothetical protein ZWY2020_028696 [Hordeum vulgare]|nr:hypothetical protein ZWY2020_028696 [Hordeum vulgare]